MTNSLFEFAGNKQTETIIPKAKKKWYQEQTQWFR